MGGWRLRRWGKRKERLVCGQKFNRRSDSRKCDLVSGAKFMDERLSLLPQGNVPQLKLLADHAKVFAIDLPQGNFGSCPIHAKVIVETKVKE
jgi:hypothetical protein